MGRLSAQDLARRRAMRAEREMEKMRRGGQVSLWHACLNGDALAARAAALDGADVSLACSATVVALWSRGFSSASGLGGHRVQPWAPGRFPLMLAAMSGSRECVRELLNLGADPAAKLYPSGMTALILAAQFGRSQCVELLAEAAPPDAQDWARALSEARHGGWAGPEDLAGLNARAEKARLNEAAAPAPSRCAPRM